MLLTAFQRRWPRRPVPVRTVLRLTALEDRDVPATFLVSNLTDNPTSPTTNSLRWAINQANTNPDADTIIFANSIDRGTINLLPFPTPLSSGASAFSISTPVVIEGRGQKLNFGSETLGDSYRFFRVGPSGNLTLNNLWLNGGSVTGGYGGTGHSGGGGAAGIGGAIYVADGTLLVQSCLFTNNSASGGSGGTNPAASGSGGGGGGGFDRTGTGTFGDGGNNSGTSYLL